MADLNIDDIKKKKVNISIENLIMVGVGISLSLIALGTLGDSSQLL